MPLSVPDPPQIQIRPKGSDGALQFWWYTSDVSGYILRCVNPVQPDRLFAANINYTAVTGLVNGVDHSFQLIATNASGESLPSSYRVSQPGILTGPPTNVVFILDGGNLTATWEPPTPDPRASAIGWYVLKAFPPSGAPLVRSAYRYSTTRTLHGLDPEVTYSYALYAINSAGYSDPFVQNPDPDVALNLWLDASYLESLYQDASGNVPVTDSSQNVLLWEDRTTGANHFSTSSSAKPLYFNDPDIPFTPAVSFEGARLSSSLILTPSNTMTMFAVVGLVPNDVSGEEDPAIFRGTGLSLSVHQKPGDQTFINYQNGVYSNPVSPRFYPPYFFSAIFVAYNDENSTNIYYTSYPPVERIITTQSSQAPLDVLSSYILGPDSSSNNTMFMNEFRVYRGVLTDLSRAEVEASLCAKWPHLARNIIAPGHSIGESPSQPVQIVDASGLIDASGMTFNMFGVNRASQIRWHTCNVLSFGPGTPENDTWNANTGVGILCGNFLREATVITQLPVQSNSTYRILPIGVTFEDVSGSGEILIRLVKEIATGTQFIEFGIAQGKGAAGQGVTTNGDWAISNGTAFINNFNGQFDNSFPSTGTSFTLVSDASGANWEYSYQKFLFLGQEVEQPDSDGIVITVSVSGDSVGVPVTFTADVSGTYSYVTDVWSIDGIPTAYNTNGVFTNIFDASGSYTIEYSLETKNNIYATEYPVEITDALPLPTINYIVSNVIPSIGNITTFTLDISGDYNYVSDTWSIDGVDISTNTDVSFSYTFDTSGQYEVACRLVTTAGEVDVSQTFVVVSAPGDNIVLRSAITNFRVPAGYAQILVDIKGGGGGGGAGGDGTGGCGGGEGGEVSGNAFLFAGSLFEIASVGTGTGGNFNSPTGADGAYVDIQVNGSSLASADGGSGGTTNFFGGGGGYFASSVAFSNVDGRNGDSGLLKDGVTGGKGGGIDGGNGGPQFDPGSPGTNGGGGGGGGSSGEGSNGGNGGAARISVTFIYDPPPVISSIISDANPVIKNVAANFTVDVSGEYRYINDIWYVNGAEISTDTTGLFTYTFNDSGLYDVKYSLITTNGTFNYTQGFFCVVTAGDPMVISRTGLLNFFVPDGYTSMDMSMTSGGGGGGGGGGTLGGDVSGGGGGGGGGGGLNASGVVTISANRLMSITVETPGTGGTGGAVQVGDNPTSEPGNTGVTGQNLSLNIGDDYISIGGGEGGFGGGPSGNGNFGTGAGGVGGNGSEDVMFSPLFSSLTLTSGLEGSAGNPNAGGGTPALGGAGGGNGGAGGIGPGTGYNSAGGNGSNGGAAVYMLTFNYVEANLPQILGISSTPAVPIVNENITFIADLSGAAPGSMTYEWSFADFTGTDSSFNTEVSETGQYLANLIIRVGDLSASYSQTFVVVAASGDPIALSKAGGAIQNFKVPEGYTVMDIQIQGGGGGGGGGGFNGGGGGGGGSGAAVLGSITATSGARISTEINGDGTAGSGGAPGSGGETLSLQIDGVTVSAGGGGGGNGGQAGDGQGGGGAGGSGGDAGSGNTGGFVDLTALSGVQGGTGGSVQDSPIGGVGGNSEFAGDTTPGVGGYGGGGGASNEGYNGGPSNYTITFSQPVPSLPTILNISSSDVVPLVGSSTAFSLEPSDLSGSISPETVYEWSLNGGSPVGGATFTPTLTLGEKIVSVSLTLGDLSASYSQTFIVVAASGDAVVLDASGGAVNNFKVPAGYTSMLVDMRGGGGGGGGGGAGGGGGGGGGSGADVSGTFDVSAGSIISIDISGTGAGGVGNQFIEDVVPGTAGSKGQTTTLHIGTSTAVAGGGFGGGLGSNINGDAGDGGGGGIASVSGLSGLSTASGISGTAGKPSYDPNYPSEPGPGGGSSGAGDTTPGVGGWGGNGNSGNGNGYTGGASRFTVAFAPPLPTFVSITATGLLASQSSEFVADLSGAVPANTVYAWSDGTNTSSSETFTQTYNSARQVNVTLTLTLGPFIRTYTQTFYVVAAAGNAIVLTSTSGLVQNFKVPAGYPSMLVRILSGGGGGGGGAAGFGGCGPAGGGGGGGADVSGVCAISADDVVSSTINGTGSGGTGQIYEDNSPPATSGSSGQALTLFINGSTKILANGGQGGNRGDSGSAAGGSGGGGASATITGLTGLSVQNGANGGAGSDGGGINSIGGSAGGNGGSGGNGGDPNNDADGQNGSNGAAATFQICFGAVTPQILEITTGAQPVINQAVTFSADLSGTLPPTTVYAWSDGTNTSSSSTFTCTYASAQMRQVTLTLTYGLFTSTYTQSFYVAAAAGSPIVLSSASGQIQNFHAPAGYPSMLVSMLSGGGGGGGAEANESSAQPAAGGGGGGATISGSCDISANVVLSTTVTGTGAGGAGQIRDQNGSQVSPAQNGSAGQALRLFIDGSVKILANGGGGGSTFVYGGAGAGATITGLTGLTVQNGANGADGAEGDPNYNTGGAGGGNGGKGADTNLNLTGDSGANGGPASFTITLGSAPPPIIRINSTMAPVINEAVTFSADLSGSVPSGTVYAWSDGTNTSSSATFTHTYTQAAEIQVTLTLTNGPFTRTLTRTFYVVDVEGGPMTLTSQYGDVKGFVVPPGYIQMEVNIIGGGGGGGGGADGGGIAGGGGGGGGGGGDVSGICTISGDEVIAITIVGSGNGGAGGAGIQGQDGADGSDGQTLTMFIDGVSKVVAGGGNGGQGGFLSGSAGQGGYGGASVSQILGLDAASGDPGLAAGQVGGNETGGPGGGNGGNGGNGGAGGGYPGDGGDPATFTITFSQTAGTLPTILSIISTPAVPVINEITAFTADLSGAAPGSMTYEWSFAGFTGTDSSFNETIGETGQYLMNLIIRLGDLSASYSQTFYVVEATNGPIILSSAGGPVVNFKIPEYYLQMSAHIIGGGGGGGGGGTNALGGTGSGGGGGGGGGDVSGSSAVTAGSIISTTVTGTGTGGGGGGVGANGASGSLGQTITIYVDSFSLVADGGGGGAGGDYRGLLLSQGGVGGGGTIDGFNDFIITSGDAGEFGGDDLSPVGGAGGAPNGGSGGAGGSVPEQLPGIGAAGLDGLVAYFSITLTAGDIPPTPTGLTQGVTTANSIELIWQDPVDLSLTGFSVYRGPDESDLSLIAEVVGFDTSYNFVDLSEDTAYYLTVAFTNATGTGNQAAPLEASTLPPAPTITNLEAVDVSIEGFRLTYTATDTDSVRYFKIIYGQDTEEIIPGVSSTIGNGIFLFGPPAYPLDNFDVYVEATGPGGTIDSDTLSFQIPAAPTITGGNVLDISITGFKITHLSTGATSFEYYFGTDSEAPPPRLIPDTSGEVDGEGFAIFLLNSDPGTGLFGHVIAIGPGGSTQSQNIEFSIPFPPTITDVGATDITTTGFKITYVFTGATSFEYYFGTDSGNIPRITSDTSGEEEGTGLFFATFSSNNPAGTGIFGYVIAIGPGGSTQSDNLEFSIPGGNNPTITDLSAVDVTTEGFTITYTSTNATSFEYYLGAVSENMPLFADISSASSASFLVEENPDIPTAPLTEIGVSIRAFGEGGLSTLSSLYLFTIPLPVPDVSYNNLLQTEVTFEWPKFPVGNALILTSALNFENSVYMPNVSQDGTKFYYTLTELTPNTDYAVTVVYSVDGGSTNITTETVVNFKTLPDIPAAPSGLEYSNITDTEVTMSWANPEDSTITSLLFYKSADGEGPPAFVEEMPAPLTSYTFTGLLPNTEYNFNMEFKNLGGTSAQANFPLAAQTRPEAPVVSVDTVTSSSIIISWPTIDYATGYEVTVDPVPGSTPNIGNPTEIDLATTVEIIDLLEATDYTIRIKSYVDDRLDGGYLFSLETEVIQKTSPANPPPAAPTNLAVGTITSTSVEVTFDAFDPNTDPLVDSMSAFVSTDGGSSYSIVAQGITLDSTYTFTDLTPLTIYYFTMSFDTPAVSGLQADGVSGETLADGLEPILFDSVNNPLPAEYTIPTGYTSVTYVMIGGGGGGGGAGGGNWGFLPAQGGFSGSSIAGTFEVTSGNPLTIVLGSGGAGGFGNSSSANNGSAGDTTVLTYETNEYSAIGGNGGLKNDTDGDSISPNNGQDGVPITDLVDSRITYTYGAGGGGAPNNAGGAGDGSGQGSNASPDADMGGSGGAGGSGFYQILIRAPPAAPTGLAVGTITSTSVEVTFDASPDPLVDTMSAYISTDDGESYTLVAEEIGLSTNYIFTDLTPETPYYFTIAFNVQVVPGIKADGVPAMTLAGGPPKPTGLTIGMVTTTSVDIAWDDPQDASILYFSAYLSSDGGTQYNIYAQEITFNTGYTFVDLSAGTQYFFKIAFSDGTTLGEQSDPIDQFTAPPQPLLFTSTTNPILSAYTILPGYTSLQYILIGGGGGGGSGVENAGGGGGAAGSTMTNTLTVAAGEVYTIELGLGGISDSAGLSTRILLEQTGVVAEAVGGSPSFIPTGDLNGAYGGSGTPAADLSDGVTAYQYGAGGGGGGGFNNGFCNIDFDNEGQPMNTAITGSAGNGGFGGITSGASAGNGGDATPGSGGGDGGCPGTGAASGIGGQGGAGSDGFYQIFLTRAPQ